MRLSMRAQWVVVGMLAFALTVGAATCAPSKPSVLSAPGPTDEDRASALVEIHEQPAPGAQDLPLPERPEAWQKQRGCDPDMDEYLIMGACYQRTGKRPPCGPKLRRHGDACYRFVSKAPSPPVSAEP